MTAEGQTTSLMVNEEDLLERVFLKIVVAESDEQFEKILATFLPSILMKLSSRKDAVKNKVLEILTHINKRLKSRPKIELPVEDLIVQYQDPNYSGIVQNFSILYIKMGYPRIENRKKAVLIPKMLSCLTGKNQDQQDTILKLIIPAIADIEYPESINERKEIFSILKNKVIKSVILDFFHDFLLLSYSPENTGQTDSGSVDTRPPPGLSIAAAKRMTFEPVLANEQIEKAKLGVIKFLSSELFEGIDVLCHFVAAIGDSHSSVSDSADTALKKFSSSSDWENNVIVDKLFKLFQGTVVAPGNARQALSADQARAAVNTRQKMKIFPFLLKSKRATDFYAAGCIQIIFESLFGDQTNAKLKKYALEFSHNMCRYSSDKTMGFAAPLLFQAAMKMISDKKTDRALKLLGYTGLGLVSKRAPHLFKRDVAIVQKLFESLEQEDKDMRLAVQETLSTIAICYKDTTGSNAQMMEALILNNVEKENPSCNLASLQLANIVFPKTHVATRYACILSSGSLKDDVREEARKGLSPNKWKDVFSIDDGEREEVSYPDFVALISFLSVKFEEKAIQKAEGAALFTNAVQEKMLVYIRDCLRNSAGVSEQEILDDDTLMKVSAYVKTLMNNIETSETIYQYISIIKSALTREADTGVQLIGLENLLEVLCCSPEKLGSIVSPDIVWMKSFMKCGKEDIRYFTARILSNLLKSLPYDQSLIFLEKLMGDLDKSLPVEVKHGTILSLAFCITGLTRDEVIIEDIDMTDEVSKKSTLVHDIVVKIASQLYSEDSLLKIGACTALGIIGRQMKLPLPDGEDDTSEVAKDPTPGSAKKLKTEQMTKLVIVKHIAEIMQKAKETKTKEIAAKTLGFLCAVDRQMVHAEKIINCLLETSKIRQIELNFSVGEALSCVGAGLLSKASRDKWSLDKPPKIVEENNSQSIMKNVVLLIIKEYVYSTATYNRQAAAIWLMSIVKFASIHSDVKVLLKDFQTAFVNLLSDSDELTQEIASRGINIVYELVDDDNKNEVVQQLVDCLMTGKKPKHSVDEDSRLFSGGTLGKSPEGGSLSTYKELCSLASSLNKPELIYKFMNLANHNALWNSKKGAAFGFLGIASLAKKQLQPYLPLLIPRLFRYQYDPNPGVQQAMSNIWCALVPEGKKVIDKYGKPILEDLKENLVNPLWRNRESSCLAMADLLKVIEVEELLVNLKEVWEIIFKVMDDIKESVRVAATIAMKNVNKVTVRLCDVTLSKHGEKTIMIILPLLLNTGLGSRVSEVRNVSLQTLVQISKNAGKLMKPHIARFAVTLLEALSALEPQALNTLNLQISNSQEAQEQLDNLRISASKSSPMMEAMKSCVQYVDKEVLKDMVPQLCDLMKSGIGLRTKVGCADFVTSITLHCRDEVTPFSGRFLKSLVIGARDGNNTVKSAYAMCIGRLAQYAREASMEKLINRLNEWYFKKENDKAAQRSSAQVYLALLRYSPDTLKLFSAMALPTIFLAMHEGKEKGNSPNDEQQDWEEIWSGMTPGTVVGIKQYQTEIVDAICSHLTSPSWSIRAQTARAAGKIAETLGESFTQPYLGKILVALLDALPGRIWEGKENLIKSLATICKRCSNGIKTAEISNSDFPKRERILNTLLKECKKDKLEYRLVVLAETADVIHSFEANMFVEIKPVIDRILKKEDDNEDSDGEKRQSRTKKLEAMTVAYESLGKCWPKDTETQNLHKSYLLNLCTESLEQVSWKSQSALLQTITAFIDRLDWKSAINDWKTEEETRFSDHTVSLIVPKVCSCAENATVGVVIVNSLTCLEILFRRLNESDILHLIIEDLGRIQELLKLMAKKSNFKIDELSKSISFYLEKVVKLKEAQKHRDKEIQSS